MKPVIVWFRRDLRLTDNPALAAAAETGRPLVPVYIVDDLDQGGAVRWWLHHSLASLGGDLKQHGASLIVHQGAPRQVLDRLLAQTEATDLFYTARYEPEARQQEFEIEALSDRVRIHASQGNYLHHPDVVKTQSGKPYKVFTPFWRRASSLGDPERPRPAPSVRSFDDAAIESQPLESLDLLPSQPNWAGGIKASWTPGEAEALHGLDNIDSVALDYHELRDRPDRAGTSRLSPHLAFGEISPRQVWHAIQAAAVHAGSSQGPAALQRQLYWRDFSAYLLFHFPSLPHTPLRSEFAAFEWQKDDEALSAWQRGLTGYPIVDAGMRQLWQTGWMHNRVRMIVASFLIKDLLIPWQTGAAWFLDTLVDADLANNSAGWQWVAGCGTDAAPYFRIFNPTSQGKKFDPDGSYIRRYVPELAKLAAEDIHKPAQASPLILRAAGVEIGKDYPAPIVDHSEARKAALSAYQSLRSSG